MPYVRLRETGRVVYTDDAHARLLVAQGQADWVPVQAVARETGSLTGIPQPGRVAGVETR